MERFECEPSPLCKYYEAGCFEDTHHVFQRSQAEGREQRRFCELPANKLKICRYLHELLEYAEGWPQYPEISVIKAVLAREA